MKKRLLAIAFLVPICIHAQNPEQYTVRLNEIKAAIQPTMWGLFFEDINRGADGGMYAELIKNSSFDFPSPMTGWETWPDRVRDGTCKVNPELLQNSDRFFQYKTIFTVTGVSCHTFSQK